MSIVKTKEVFSYFYKQQAIKHCVKLFQFQKKKVINKKSKYYLKFFKHLSIIGLTYIISSIAAKEYPLDVCFDFL